MQLHAQYSVDFHEICTTSRSWKDLHFEGIKSGPPPIQDLIYHHCNFLSLYFLDQSNALRAANKAILKGDAQCVQGTETFYTFLFFHFGHLSIQSVASSISFGMIYSILLKIPFKW